MTKWAYEMSNRELVDAFASACARSGFSNSGLVIDDAGPSLAAEAGYLKGVLFARLEGKNPPFSRGDAVRNKTGGDVHAENKYSYLLPSDSRQQIRRIHYKGSGKWLLEFKDIPEDEERGYLLFNANDFVAESATAATNK